MERGETHHLRGWPSALNLPYFFFHTTWSAHRLQQPAQLALTACSSAVFALSGIFLPLFGWKGVTFLYVLVWSCVGMATRREETRQERDSDTVAGVHVVRYSSSTHAAWWCLLPLAAGHLQNLSALVLARMSKRSSADSGLLVSSFLL